MRRYTREELDWIKKFDRSYNHDRHVRTVREDTARLPERIGLSGWGGDGQPVDYIHELIGTADASIYEKLTYTQREIMEPLTRKVSNNSNRYSPADYYALPQAWYTNAWVDRVNESIDRDRGLSDEDDTGVAGIIRKDGHFQVSSFFNGQLVRIGNYINLEEAKQALVKYNKEVTGRGYGVDI